MVASRSRRCRYVTFFAPRRTISGNLVEPHACALLGVAESVWVVILLLRWCPDRLKAQTLLLA